MRRHSHNLLFLMIVLSLGAGMPLKAGTIFRVASVRGFPGAIGVFPIYFRGETNVVALQADISFSPAYLTVGSPVPAGALSQAQVFNFSRPQTNVLRLLIYSLNNTPMSNGVIANVPFTVAAGAHLNSVLLSLTNVVMARADATPIVSTNIAGAIIINPLYIRPDGKADFFLSSTAGQHYYVQASTDLVNWDNVSTNNATADFIEFTDFDAPNYPDRFYRLEPAP